MIIYRLKLVLWFTPMKIKMNAVSCQHKRYSKDLRSRRSINGTAKSP